MHTAGFGEAEQATFSHDPKALVGQFRRFGEYGPAYEIVRISNEREAFIHVIYSGEQLDFPIAEIMTHPIAETIP
jgi:hypothetical protein